MSIEKNMNTRIQHKHDIEANWSKATNFIPKAGELVIYDADENYPYARVKIGDGITTINKLNFIDETKVDKNELIGTNELTWDGIALNNIQVDWYMHLVSHDIPVGFKYVINGKYAWNNGEFLEKDLFVFSGENYIGLSYIKNPSSSAHIAALAILKDNTLVFDTNYPISGFYMNGDPEYGEFISPLYYEWNLLDQKANKEDLVQSNWNENDEAAPDYIKNRTHYTVIEEIAFVKNWDGVTDGMTHVPGAGGMGDFYLYSNDAITPDDNATFELSCNLGGELDINNPMIIKAAEYYFYVHSTTALCGVVIVFNDTAEVPHPVLGSSRQVTLTKGTWLFCSMGHVAQPVSLIQRGEYKPLSLNYMPYTTPGGEAFNGIQSHYISGTGNHAENRSENYGNYSHSEGSGVVVLGNYGHAEGGSIVGDTLAHAEGTSAAIGHTSHAEGSSAFKSYKITGSAKATTFTLNEAFSGEYIDRYTGLALYLPEMHQLRFITAYDPENLTVTVDKAFSSNALNDASVQFIFSGAFNHASHSEGFDTLARASSSHAEGEYSRAYGYISHAEGQNTIAAGNVQHTQGKFNVVDSESRYAHIVGNGEDFNNRSNTHTLDWDGNAWFSGDVYVGSTSGTNKDEGSKKLATEEYVNSLLLTEFDALTILAEMGMVAPAVASDDSIYTDENGALYSL